MLTLPRWQLIVWSIMFLIWPSLYMLFVLCLDLEYTTPVIRIAKAIGWIILCYMSCHSFFAAALTLPSEMPAAYRIPDAFFEEEQLAIKLHDHADTMALEHSSPSLLSVTSTQPLIVTTNATVTPPQCDEDEDECMLQAVKQAHIQLHRRISDLAHKERKLPVVDIYVPFGPTKHPEVIKCPRFCKICRVIKPPRAHHCSQCKRCVRRMDHHCPTIGICVHLHNHKFFALFLFWITLLCFYTACTVTPTLVYICTTVHLTKYISDDDLLNCIIFFSVVTGNITAISSFIMLMVFKWRIWMGLFNNQTTLEHLRMVTDYSRFSRNSVSREEAYPYHLGSARANFESIFGPSICLWLVPVPSTPADDPRHHQE